MRKSNNSPVLNKRQLMRHPEGLKELVNQFFDDYEVYVSEDIQMEGDPTSFEEAMRSAHSSKWLEAMDNEIKSMKTNEVWNLETIPKGAKTVCYKWVYKTKHDSKGNIERFKA